MKKLILFMMTVTMLLSCNNGKKQEKELLNQVIAVHDKVMSSDEQLMKNKMILDSLVKVKSPVINMDSARVYLKLIDSADDAMSNWMHQFDAENKNKSHDEVMNYLEVQKKLITGIDAQINVAVYNSNKYLKTQQTAGR